MQQVKKISLEAVKSKIITPKDSIITVIIKSLKQRKLGEGDIVVISSKVVAVSQGRVVTIDSEEQFIQQVIKEADTVIPNNTVSKHSPLSVILTIKNGIYVPWAGVDRSNVKKGQAVLWPKNPYKEAYTIRKGLKKHYKLKNHK